MVHRRMIHGNFRLGHWFASSFGYRVPHRAMALGFFFALCLGVSLRLGGLLRLRGRMTGMLCRRGGGEN